MGKREKETGVMQSRVETKKSGQANNGALSYMLHCHAAEGTTTFDSVSDVHRLLQPHLPNYDHLLHVFNQFNTSWHVIMLPCLQGHWGGRVVAVMFLFCHHGKFLCKEWRK